MTRFGKRFRSRTKRQIQVPIAMSLETLTAISDIAALIPNPSVAYTTPDATGGPTFTPVADQTGTTTRTVPLENRH